MVVAATFVTENIISGEYDIIDKIVAHNIAINYRLMCYTKLSLSDLNCLFIKSFLYRECNFNRLTEEQKVNFLTLNNL